MAKRKAKKVVLQQKNVMFRLSPEQLCEIAEKIREKINDEDNPKPKHLEAMKNCPLWNFYRPFHEGRIHEKGGIQKKHKIGRHILNTFDPVKEVFQLGGGKEFKSTAEQLAVIFGLQRTKAGAEEFTFDAVTQPNEGQKNLSLQQTEFLKTYLKGKTQMKRKDILNSLYATAGDVTKPDDFVKLLVLYFCVAIFFPRLSGASLPSKFLKYIFKMDQMSWPDLIHSYLLEALKEAEKPYNSVRGCIVYILFWFAEVTHSISKNEGELGKCKPRFARWNTRKLAEKIMNDGMTSLKQDLTGSFIDPLDEDEQSLMTPIEIRQATLVRIREKRVRDVYRDEDLDLSPDSDSNGESNEDWELSPDIDSDGESDEDWELSPDGDASRRSEDLAHVCLSKKRKISRKESHPPDGKGICNAEPENPPLSEPMLPAIPILSTQDFVMLNLTFSTPL
ncbi:uncharacterized protein LOC113322612 [Papaver somniferum]|uniref:uncharacterized protein LOC113322612 n=1 Tax=Papaver somniferum TaxID=3469 RepID=UPI000E6F9AC5|nr:uncharacterized protein LOC113322612 [Papaver somniferum]